jgi:hypothetical protein
MPEVGFWGMSRQPKRRETREFFDPAHPEVVKKITFETMGAGEEIAAQAEAEGLILQYVTNGQTCMGGDGQPVDVNPSLLRAACRLRWHQPEAERWDWIEWVGAFLVWPTAIWDVITFAAEVDAAEAEGADPLAPGVAPSSATAPPESTPEP